MAHIPKNAIWYIAGLVLETRVEGDARNVVHKNLVLVRGVSPDDAYTRSLAFGAEAEDDYRNPAGARVQVRFVGLSALNVVHDELDDGAELLYDEIVDVPASQVGKMVLAKGELAAFRPVQPSKGPDYRVA